MKSLFFSIVIMVLIAGCNTKTGRKEAPDTKAQKQKVEKTLHAFFEAFDNYNYKRFRDLTTGEFVLIENGSVWSLDTSLKTLKNYESKGAKMVHKLSDIETTVEGSTAWMTYSNSGVITVGGQKRPMEWTESAVFTKRDNEWKLAMLHSTVVEPDTSQVK